MSDPTDNDQSLKLTDDSGDILPPLRDISAIRQHLAKGRHDSIIPTIGKEGLEVKRQSCRGRVMAVFTSGGDSQGT
jgi:hypothetical protein